MTPLLAAQGLGHTFGRNWLFRNVDLDLYPGNRLLVLGKNGSGKSTLLRCLAGLETPREGTIRQTGRLGFSALDLSLYPSLTAAEHLDLFHQMVGTTPATQALAQVGLQDHARTQVGVFSTGMRGRLKLALALAGDPQVLVLDEPAAALDQDGVQTLHQTVEQFPGAVVIATNSVEERGWATHELDLGP